MKKSALALLTCMLVMMGCSSTPTRPSIATYEDVFGKSDVNDKIVGCGYDELKTTEYKLTDEKKQSVQYTFILDLNSPIYNQRNPQLYRNIVDNRFKVLRTGLLTGMSKSLGANKLTDIVLNKQAYRLKSNRGTSFITPSCEVFYLDFLRNFERTSKIFFQHDGSAISPNDYMTIVGKSQLSKADLSAMISFDEFDNAYELKTKAFNSFFIRGSIKKDSNEVLFTQLYADIKFSEEWGHLKYAKDKRGKSLDVTKIDTDVNCQRFGCELTETVGISLSSSYLKNNPEGFTLKIYGTREVVLEVPQDMVQSYIKSINTVLKK